MHPATPVVVDRVGVAMVVVDRVGVRPGGGVTPHRLDRVRRRVEAVHHQQAEGERGTGPRRRGTPTDGTDRAIPAARRMEPVLHATSIYPLGGYGGVAVASLSRHRHWREVPRHAVIAVTGGPGSRDEAFIPPSRESSWTRRLRQREAGEETPGRSERSGGDHGVVRVRRCHLADVVEGAVGTKLGQPAAGEDGLR